MQTKIINLFCGPGGGKSTQAAGLFYEMKKLNMNVEMPYEFPKLLAWDKSYEMVKDQLYVLANQHRNIARLHGQVDYIVVDSPIMLSLVYKNRYSNDLDYPAAFYGFTFNEFVVDLHKQYNSINIVLEIDDSMFQTDGRFQGLEESKEIDDDITTILKQYDIDYYPIKVNEKSIDTILSLL
jgi:hypothetical protein